MAGENLLKKAADWDSLASGLEAVDGAIQLRAGGSLTADANSLDMTALPSPPWTSLGTQPTNVRDGEILEIFDNSAGDIRGFNLPDPDFSESLSSGVSFHVKARSVVNLNSLNSSLIIDDGTRRFWVEFQPDGTFDVVATATYDVAKYEWTELFISLESNVADIWIWNPRTLIWDVVATGVATVAIGSDRVFFGSGSTASFGRSFWDFLIWFTGDSTTPFLSTSPVSTMGVVALPVGTIVNGVGNYRTSIAGSATLKPSINLNDSGFSALYDDIETLNTFLFANPVEITNGVDSLDLRNTHGSNGVEQAKFWPVEGPNLTGGGGNILAHCIF